MTLRLPLAFACSLLFAGTVACAPGVDVDETEASGDEVIASSASVQVIRHLGEAEQRARVDAFIARNGEGWAPPAPALFTAVNRLTGSIVDMRKTGPYGADVTLSEAEAVATARSFLERNADLLGLTRAEIAACTFRANPIGTGDYRWSVGVSGESRQPGYEAFDTVAKRISLSVSLGRDGGPRVVHSLFGRDLPKLTLSTEPALSANDPRTRREVLGTELVWRIADGSPYDMTDDSQEIPLGRVEPGDITDSKTTIFFEHRQNETVLRLAWQIEVTKTPDYTFYFTVDATTGKRLDQNQGAILFFP